ncbi:unnamed protein product, partial [Closterium sp. NIES-53]
VLQRFGFQFSSPQPTPLSTSHSLLAPPLDESVEPSGPYPELVGCLMYLMTCTRPDLAYPLSLLARYVAPAPILYVDNKAMSALCQEHRTKHIALRYFLARELQHRGQLCLAYVATRANTADIFTKALPPSDHQRFSTVLGLLALLFLTGLHRGQLCLAYVATRANTADIFTKALPPSDHQRFSTVLGLVPTLPHLLTALLCFS